jgi:hypothetical protein
MGASPFLFIPRGLADTLLLTSLCTCGLKRGTDQFLSFFLDLLQMGLVFKALGINFIHIFGT